MTSGSFSSPAITRAGSPGRSCCSEKMMTDTKNSVGMSCSSRLPRNVSTTASLVPLEHDPEKWTPVFGERSCSTNELERDDDSKKSHPAHGRTSARPLLQPQPDNPHQPVRHLLV